MRKGFLVHALPMLILCCLVPLPHTASAQLLAGVHVGYGRTNYSQVLGEKNLTNTEWSSGVWANYRHEDLLFTGFYHGSLGLQDFKSSRHLAHIGASYRFLEEDMLQVYGGLGYQLLSTRFDTPQVDKGNVNTFTGHGFTGQVVVDIAITEELRTMATVVANPWVKWAHQTNNITDGNIDSGHAFLYKLELFYDFSTDFGAHLSVLGNTYRVPSFSRDTGDIGETKSSSVSVNLGVTRHF